MTNCCNLRNNLKSCRDTIEPVSLVVNDNKSWHSKNDKIKENTQQYKYLQHMTLTIQLRGPVKISLVSNLLLHFQLQNSLLICGNAFVFSAYKLSVFHNFHLDLLSISVGQLFGLLWTLKTKRIRFASCWPQVTSLKNRLGLKLTCKFFKKSLLNP